MSARRAFHADGPEKENALSPNFVRRRGTSYRPLSVDRRRLVDLAEIGSTMSARYTSDSPKPDSPKLEFRVRVRVYG